MREKREETAAAAALRALSDDDRQRLDGLTVAIRLAPQRRRIGLSLKKRETIRQRIMTLEESLTTLSSDPLVGLYLDASAATAMLRGWRTKLEALEVLLEARRTLRRRLHEALEATVREVAAKNAIRVPIDELIGEAWGTAAGCDDSDGDVVEASETLHYRSRKGRANKARVKPASSKPRRRR